jgi:hypothetical protein
MLVFAVLRDRSGLTAKQGSVVVVHRIEHQLVRACATTHTVHAPHSKTACVCLLATAVADAACCR